MQILHISDTHLGKRPYSQDFREQDIYDTFNQLIDLAIKEHVDAIIHTGDLFDISEPTNQAEFEALVSLRKLKDNNIPFISIAGDHDTPKKAYSQYPQRLLEEIGLVIFLRGNENIKYTINDIEIYGISHIPNIYKDKLKERLSRLKPESKKSILMLHQGIKEELKYEGAYQIAENDLPRNIPYFACGHIHNRMLKTFDDGRILEIAGAPDIMREEEIDGYKQNGKGATLIDFSTNQPKPQFINIDIRRQFVEEIDTTRLEQDITRILNQLQQYKERKPLLHIILKGIYLPREHLNKKLEMLRPYTSLVRIYKDETKTKEEQKIINLPEQTKIDSLILDYLTKVDGFSKEESEVILDIIKHADEKEYVKNQLKKILNI